MTTAGWITFAVSVATLIVGAIVTLSVSALQRRQMRQIELHREDPSVPLIPPPHPFTKFLKTHGIFVINFILNIWFLIDDLRQTGPITRFQVFGIAFYTVVLFALVLMEAMIMFIGKATEVAKQYMNMFDRLVRILAGEPPANKT